MWTWPRQVSLTGNGSVPAQVEHQQPEELRDYFRERLAYYRQLSLKLPGGNDPVYQKEPKE